MQTEIDWPALSGSALGDSASIQDTLNYVQFWNATLAKTIQQGIFTNKALAALMIETAVGLEFAGKVVRESPTPTDSIVISRVARELREHLRIELAAYTALNPRGLADTLPDAPECPRIDPERKDGPNP